MNLIIGFGGQFHDSNISIADYKGNIFFSLEEERLSRTRHHCGPPDNALRLNKELLANALRLKCLSPFSELAGLPIDIYYSGGTLDTSRRQSVLNKIFKNKIESYWIDHHFCHSCYSRMILKDDKLLSISIDAMGSNQCASVYYFNKKQYDKVVSIDSKYSLGLIWENACEILGYYFEINDNWYQAKPGTICGLSALGNPVYLKKLINKVFLKGIYGYEFKDCYSFDWDSKNLITPNLVNKWLNLKYRKPNSPLVQLHADLASSIQKFTEYIVINWVDSLLKYFKPNILSFTGGLALNPLLNYHLYKICERYKINFWVPSAPSDAGISLGAIGVEFLKNDIILEKSFYLKYPFLGLQWSKSNILETVEKHKLKYKDWGEKAEDIAVKRILEFGYVVWCKGRSEHGPRALGARSILGDPRKYENKNIINILKGREWFRPVAPMILKSECDKYFDISQSPYMNIGAKAKLNAIKCLPAAVHYDKSSRIQTADEHNKSIFSLLNKWFLETGIPCLLNTSFNRNEPLVESPEDAIKNAKKMGIKSIFFEGIEIYL